VEAASVQRIRFSFSKEGYTRFISHLDLARALERAFARAGLPVAYSQGFNRRPRLQLAAALPLGFSSDCELADIWMTRRMDPDTVKAQLVAKMAPGIQLHSAVEIPLSAPALQNLTSEAVYSVTLLDPVDAAELQIEVDKLLQASSLIRQLTRGRKVKSYDLRPLIITLRVVPGEDGTSALMMRLHLKPGMTGRPDEVLLALGLDPHDARIHRIEIVLAEQASEAGS